MGTRRRFAVFLCAEEPEYVEKKYGGYFHVFVRLLSEEGEAWDLYHVARGHFPDDHEIDSYDGFVVTGSCHDAHGNDAWICRLVALLKKLHAMQKKVLADVQLVARSIGCHVGATTSGSDKWAPRNDTFLDNYLYFES
ncbi:hypothetical protein ACLOJK_003139 [Asimina triloba]